MAKLYNLARMTTATTGTGTITLGSAVLSYLSFASSGVLDGETVTYAIVDGSNREIGRGVYTASGTTLTRTVLESTNSNTAINLSGSAEVFITAAAEDITSNVEITGGSITGITDLAVADGGTGVSSFTAYSVVLGGTTSTNPLQNVSGLGTSGQVLTSGGSGAMPTWSAIPEPAELSTASGSAPSYSARAWVNFNGISDTIRSSGNVTSVTANLAGDYTVSFTTALPSADYAVSGVIGQYVNNNFAVGALCGYNNTTTVGSSTTKSTTAYRCQTSWATNTKADCNNVSLIFIV